MAGDLVNQRKQVLAPAGSLERELCLVRLFRRVPADFPQVEVLFDLSLSDLSHRSRGSGANYLSRFEGISVCSGNYGFPPGGLGYRFARSAARTRGSQSPVTM